MSLAELKKWEEFKKYNDEWKLFFYKPYAKQREFHKLGATYRERLFLAGNQLGKCVVYHTPIETPCGTRFAGEIRAGDLVYAWDGECRVVGRVRSTVVKPVEPVVRVYLQSGRFFDCALKHRVLTKVGYAHVQALLTFAAYLPSSSLEYVLSVHGASGRRLSQIARDWIVRYFPGFHPCDVRPLLVKEGGPDASSLPGDALPYTQLSSHLDALERRYTSSGQLYIDLPSSWYGRVRSWVQSFAYLVQAENYGVRPTRYLRQAFRLLSTAVGVLLRSVVGATIDRHSPLLELVSPLNDGDKIIAYEPVGSKPIYDFEVEEFHNYISCGIVHHNTLCAGYEVAFHATGIYPEWWEGKRFKRPIRAWFGSETAELTRDGQQRILLGPVGSFGSGAIPKDLLVETMKARGIPDAVEVIRVKHKSGGISTLIAKAYADGREKWQADTLEVVWYDEEPPISIYTEGLTRTNAGEGGKGGIVFITETPLKGMSDVVYLFRKDVTEQRISLTMTIDDVEHYSPAQKKAVVDAYLPHEREARARGEPMLGSGAIFPFATEQIACDPIEIPKHFAVIGGMDFGIDHPFAAVKVAWDKDADCIYVCNAYRIRGATPVVHASALKPWGSFRWAWPHDGFVRDKRSGVQLAQFYRDEGLDLVSEHAQYPDDRGNGLEASILDVYKRMESGRFKVFRHLSDWFEEFRMYHRVDGQPIKERDDLLSATRYAVMSLRFADQEIVLKPPERYRIRKQRRYSWMAA